MPKTTEKKIPVSPKPEIICRESFRVKLFSLDSKNRQNIEKQMKRLASPTKKTNGFFSISKLRNGKSIVYSNSGKTITFMDLLTSVHSSPSKRRTVK